MLRFLIVFNLNAWAYTSLPFALYSADVMQYFSFPSMFVDPLSPCIFLNLQWLWMITHRFCGPTTVAEFFIFHSEMPDSAVFLEEEVETGCCCWLACEDERGKTRSRDLDLSALLVRFLCSADDSGPADGDKESSIVKILIWYLIIWSWSNHWLNLWFLWHWYVRIYSITRSRPLYLPLSLWWRIIIICAITHWYLG